MDKKRNLLEDKNNWQLNSKEQERHDRIMEGLRFIPGTLFSGLIPYWAIAYAKKDNIPCLTLSYIITDNFVQILYSVSPLKGGESQKVDRKLKALHEGEKSGKLMKEICEMLIEVWKFRDCFVHGNETLEKHPEWHNDARLEHGATLLKYCLASAYSVRASDTEGIIDVVFPEFWEINEQGRARVKLHNPTTIDLGWFDRHVLGGNIKNGPVEIVECPEFQNETLPSN